MKIYTRKGDKGRTLGGEVSKADALIEALGAVDELNSWIGLSRGQKFLDEELRRIQDNLLTIGSELAGSKLKMRGGETKRLERLIDRLTLQLPRLASFIYPVGYLQVARTIARRAERRVVAAGVGDKNVLKYLNRLSDALFVMGRWVNYKEGVEEEIWKG